MSDPVIEATERAWDIEEPDHFPTVADRAIMLTAAREALAPIRELHSPCVIWEYDDVNGEWLYDENDERIVLDTVCRECSTDSYIERAEDCEFIPSDEFPVLWPCGTAKLIYTTEELQ